MCLEYDLIAQAETGSGKTLAYLVPVISLVHGLKRCSPPRRFRPFAIIIVPTRELAAQIRNEAKKLVENLDVTVALTYGGLDFEVSARDIASGCDIFVGTPGRLIKAVEREGRWGGIYLHNVCCTVVDEADDFIRATFSEYSMEFYRQQMTSEPFYILRRRGTNTIDFMWRSDGVNSFMHRIGRTGRAGNRGCAITYFDPVRDRRHGEYIAEMLQSLGENVPEFLRYHVEE
ncbi:hypothetical protein QR680_010806 [Steinernema hermaphroditum]|uniref:Helicase ATP-binding domain-containing protein n=1 Tax=Steinernema hermaphroditum TaxID=289476 RepID=A0AA39IRK9_9BILA|nr:hypothetical protein QR680_010806 [Steinernema hermaphroditum]